LPTDLRGDIRAADGEFAQISPANRAIGEGIA
jgi:hypothetical protein